MAELVVHPDPFDHSPFRTAARRMVGHLEIDDSPIPIELLVEGRSISRQDYLRLALMKYARKFSMIVVRHLNPVDVTTPLGAGCMYVRRVTVDEALDVIEFADGVDGRLARKLNSLKTGDDLG